MHMSSNRIGVDNLDEIFLAHGLSAALSDVCDASRG
jgi:hypothetical protein